MELNRNPIRIYRNAVLVQQQQILNELDTHYDAYVSNIRKQQKDIKKQMKLLFYREISDISQLKSNHKNESIRMDIFELDKSKNIKNIPILGENNPDTVNMCDSSSDSNEPILCLSNSANYKNNMNSSNVTNVSENDQNMQSIATSLPPLPSLTTLNTPQTLPPIPSQFLSQSHDTTHSSANLSAIMNILTQLQNCNNTNLSHSENDTPELDNILAFLAMNNVTNTNPLNPNGNGLNINKSNTPTNTSMSIAPIISDHKSDSNDNVSIPPLIEQESVIKKEPNSKYECDNMPFVSVNAINHSINSMVKLKPNSDIKSIKSEIYHRNGNILLEDVPLISRVEMSDANKNKNNPFIIHKTSDGRKWKCEFCRKWIQFECDKSVIIHLINHKKERKFKCLYCSKVFKRKSDVTRHSRTHTGERPHKCHICQKGFGTKYCLKTHIRTHTGEMPYKCSFCGKSFRQNSHLTVHWRTHTGDKPYECKICGKRFSQHSTLAVHHRIHNGVKPFVCVCCNREFTQRHSLQRHIKNVHKEFYNRNGEKLPQIQNLHTVQKMRQKLRQNERAKKDLMGDNG